MANWLGKPWIERAVQLFCDGKPLPRLARAQLLQVIQLPNEDNPNTTALLGDKTFYIKAKFLPEALQDFENASCNPASLTFTQIKGGLMVLNTYEVVPCIDYNKGIWEFMLFVKKFSFMAGSEGSTQFGEELINTAAHSPFQLKLKEHWKLGQVRRILQFDEDESTTSTTQRMNKEQLMACLVDNHSNVFITSDQKAELDQIPEFRDDYVPPSSLEVRSPSQDDLWSSAVSHHDEMTSADDKLLRLDDAGVRTHENRTDDSHQMSSLDHEELSGAEKERDRCLNSVYETPKSSRPPTRDSESLSREQQDSEEYKGFPYKHVMLSESPPFASAHGLHPRERLEDVKKTSENPSVQALQYPCTLYKDGFSIREASMKHSAKKLDILETSGNEFEGGENGTSEKGTSVITSIRGRMTESTGKRTNQAETIDCRVTVGKKQAHLSDATTQTCKITSKHTWTDNSKCYTAGNSGLDISSSKLEQSERTEGHTSKSSDTKSMNMNSLDNCTSGQTDQVFPRQTLYRGLNSSGHGRGELERNSEESSGSSKHKSDESYSVLRDVTLSDLTSGPFVPGLSSTARGTNTTSHVTDDLHPAPASTRGAQSDNDKEEGLSFLCDPHLLKIIDIEADLAFVPCSQPTQDIPNPPSHLANHQTLGPLGSNDHNGQKGVRRNLPVGYSSRNSLRHLAHNDNDKDRQESDNEMNSISSDESQQFCTAVTSCRTLQLRLNESAQNSPSMQHKIANGPSSQLSPSLARDNQAQGTFSRDNMAGYEGSIRLSLSDSKLDSAYKSVTTDSKTVEEDLFRNGKTANNIQQLRLEEHFTHSEGSCQLNDLDVPGLVLDDVSEVSFDSHCFQDGNNYSPMSKGNTRSGELTRARDDDFGFSDSEFDDELRDWDSHYPRLLQLLDKCDFVVRKGGRANAQESTSLHKRVLTTVVSENNNDVRDYHDKSVVRGKTVLSRDQQAKTTVLSRPPRVAQRAVANTPSSTTTRDTSSDARDTSKTTRDPSMAARDTSKAARDPSKATRDTSTSTCDTSRNTPKISPTTLNRHDSVHGKSPVGSAEQSFRVEDDAQEPIDSQGCRMQDRYSRKRKRSCTEPDEQQTRNKCVLLESKPCSPDSTSDVTNSNSSASQIGILSQPYELYSQQTPLELDMSEENPGSSVPDSTPAPLDDGPGGNDPLPTDTRELPSSTESSRPGSGPKSNVPESPVPCRPIADQLSSSPSESDSSRREHELTIDTPTCLSLPSYQIPKDKPGVEVESRLDRLFVRIDNLPTDDESDGIPWFMDEW